MLAAWVAFLGRLGSLGKPLEQGRGGALGFSAEEKGGREGRGESMEEENGGGGDEEEEAGQ